MNIAEVAAARKELASLRREVPQLRATTERLQATCVAAVGIRANGWWIVKCPGRTLLIPVGEKWPRERP